jgi:hypothetical protein
VGLISRDLSTVFRTLYGGLFSKGFDEPQLQRKQFSIPSSHPIFIPCVNDSTRRQVNAINEEDVLCECKNLGISGKDVQKLVRLHKEMLMNNDEIRTTICHDRPFMGKVFEIWDTSNMRSFSLTSVGIAIGHANVKKSLGEFTNLERWIN